MSIAITQVDAFTSRPFAGNPAAVCILPAAPEESWMRDVAREMNLAETAFLVPQNGGYNLRWFTPAVEVDLCGHATLASAHVLWEEGHLAATEQARFHTRSGLLLAERAGDWIEMDFPAKAEQAAETPAGLATALGTQPVYVGRNQFDYLVEVESAAALRAIQPDHAALRKLQTLYRKGLLEGDTSPEVHMEGASNLLGLDLHLTRETLRDLLGALEQKRRLMELLDRFLEQPPGTLTVRVGLEEAHPAMKHLVLIGMTIQLASGLPAKVAVLGPMRMHYERVMSAVLETSKALENAQF